MVLRCFFTCGFFHAVLCFAPLDFALLGVARLGLAWPCFADCRKLGAVVFRLHGDAWVNYHGRGGDRGDDHGRGRGR